MNDFLQSEEWRKFQERVGHRTVRLEGDHCQGNGITHRLPLVGQYLYFPRGPILQKPTTYHLPPTTFEALVGLGKKEKVRWIRIEPSTEGELEEYKKFVTVRQAHGDNLAIIKAPHDTQPRETFVIDIALEESVLLEKMKSKTRYNIRLAEKKGVHVFTSREEKHIKAFLDLMTRTATRKEITPHPESHYAHFFSSLPRENLFLFIAEYQGAVLAANLLVLYGETATYLHGGSNDVHRDAMAPYLLQWEQIRFAKEKGIKRYDFGGVMTQPTTHNLPPTTLPWAGITRFKTGFSPATMPTIFPGTYDIVLDSRAYAWYNILRRVKGMFHR